MFHNIGGKIKGLAELIAWLGILLSFLVGLIMFMASEGESGIGLLVIIIGSVSAWIGSFLLYGLGRLIENSDKLVIAQGISLDQSVPELQHMLEQQRVLKRLRNDGTISEGEYLEKLKQLRGGAQ